MEQMHAATGVQAIENARPEGGSLAANLLVVGLLSFGLFAVAAPQFAVGILLGVLVVVGGRRLRGSLVALAARSQMRRAEPPRFEPAN